MEIATRKVCVHFDRSSDLDWMGHSTWIIERDDLGNIINEDRIPLESSEPDDVRAEVRNKIPLHWQEVEYHWRKIPEEEQIL